MRFDDLIRRPAKQQKPLTYTESLQAKLNAQMTEKPAPKLTGQQLRMKKIDLLRKLSDIKSKGYKLTKE